MKSIMDEEMLKLEKQELLKIKKLINRILGRSARGLFYSMGQSIGNNISEKAKKDAENDQKYLENAADILKQRNYVKSISFEGEMITAKGSIEIVEKEEIEKHEESNKCNILRGILVALFEEMNNKNMYCEEVECESTGSDKCVFKIEKEVI